MKELSIEEKAKSYDEAIKQIKECTPDENGFITIYPQEIFPELKEEDKDEKLRKRLIQIFKSYQNPKTHLNPNKWEGLKICDIIDWLEKQKTIDVLDEEERKFVDNVDSYRKEVDAAYQRGYDEGIKATLEKQGEQSVSHDDIVDNYFIKEIIEAAIYWGKEAPTENGIIPKDKLNHAIDYYCFELKKQGGQNSTDEIGNYDHKKVLQAIINEQTSSDETPYPETLEKAIDLYYYSYGNGKGEFEHLSLEKFRDIVYTFVSDYGQKSSWSEEEIEKAAQEWDAKANFKPFSMTPTGVKQDITTHKESFKAGINWILKSLRPQNTTVTDEELAQAKKDAYNDVLNKIEYDSENPTFDDGWSAAIWYLKKRNAQPQSTWKPSEEQIYALRSVVTELKHSDNKYQEIIEDLYNDLKKLREE